MPVKMKSRQNVFLFVVALSVCLFMTPSAIAKTTLTVLDWRVNSTQDAQRYFQTIKERFEARFPDVEVVYTDTPMNDIPDRIVVGVAAGSAPDVVSLSMNYAQDLFRAGLFMDITHMVEQTSTHSPDQFIPVTQLHSQVDGRIYGVPIVLDSTVLFYNIDHFEESALSTDPYAIATWDDFVETAKKLMRLGSDGRVSRYGFGETVPHRIARPVFFNGWLTANGGRFYADDTLSASGFNTPQGRETLQHLHDLIMVHNVVGGNFTRRSASMQVEVNATPRFYKQNAPDLRFGMMSFPQGPSGNSRGTTVWSNIMGIPVTTEHPDLAWEYIKEFTSLQGSIDMLHILDYVGSPRFDFYQSEEWMYSQTANPWMAMYPEIIMVGSMRPVRFNSELEALWQEHVQSAAIGERAMESALDEAERLYNVILRD